MRALKRKSFALAVLACLGLLASTLLIVFGKVLPGCQVAIPLAGILAASAVAAGFWLRGLSKLRTARLIEENPILHIRTAVIKDLVREAPHRPESEYTEVIVSYFGILLGEKVIKFNQDGVRIRAVEIGPDFISFTYGTEGQVRNIRLLRPAIDTAELERIVEQLRYEIGVIPTLVL